MNRLMTWTVALVMAVALAGCAATPQSGLPCDHCTAAVTHVNKRAEYKVYCVVDGKVVDCRTNPEGCPTCKK